MKQPRNIGDEGQVRERNAQARLIREQEANDVRSLLNSEEGRRYLWRLLSRCRVYKSSFTGSSETFFLEGQRHVGLAILDDIMDAEPDAYLLMIKENRKGDDKDV
jgi:hypothetical protein